MTSGSRWISAGVPSAIRRPKSSTVTRSARPMTMPMSCSTRTTEMPSVVADLEDRRGHRARSPRRSCRPPARRAAAARLECTARGPARPASGRRRTARRPGVSSLSPSSRKLGDLLRRARRARRASRVAPRQPQPGGEEAGLGQVVAAEHEVLGDRLASATARCSGRRGPTPSRAIWCGRMPVSTASPSRTVPSVGAVDAGQHVEHRRLAGAVGPDDGVHVPGSTVNDTPSSAVRPPKRTVTSSTTVRRDSARARHR